MKDDLKRITWQYAARSKSDPERIIAQAADLNRLNKQLNEKRILPGDYFIARLLPPQVALMV
jgi:hypothetical protein